MNIAVYLGSSSGNDPAFQENARKLGSWIGAHHHTLVYGGASVGTMGVLADAALAAGGNVIGVMPRFMVNGRKDHHGLQKMIVTEDMSSRKKKMMELGDCYIALPGGPGTLEEVSEVISSQRLGLIHGNCLLLNTNGYYDALKFQLERMVRDGFIQKDEISQVFFVNTLEECIRKVSESHA